MDETWYYISVNPDTKIIQAVQQSYPPGFVWPNYYHVDRDPMMLMGQKVTRLEKVSSDPDIYSFDCEPIPPEEPTEPGKGVANL